MGADIHYCLPAECPSFLSTLGCSILYPCRRVDVKFQVFPGRIELIPMDRVGWGQNEHGGGKQVTRNFICMPKIKNLMVKR